MILNLEIDSFQDENVFFTISVWTDSTVSFLCFKHLVSSPRTEALSICMWGIWKMKPMCGEFVSALKKIDFELEESRDSF